MCCVDVINFAVLPACSYTNCLPGLCLKHRAVIVLVPCETSTLLVGLVEYIKGFANSEFYTKIDIILDVKTMSWGPGSLLYALCHVEVITVLFHQLVVITYAYLASSKL